MRVRIVITTLIAIVWLGSVYTLHRRESDRSFLEDKGRVDVIDGMFILREDYLGIFLNDQRIGYSDFLLREADETTSSAADAKVYLFEGESVMRIDAMGIPFQIKTSNKGSVDQNLALRDFRFSFEASGQRIESVGFVEENVLKVTTLSEGAEHVNEYPLDGPIYSPDIVHLVVARDGVEPDKEIRIPIYDPLTTSIGDVDVKVEGRETIEWSGEEVEAYRITLSYKGFQEEAWIDENGDVYRERSSIIGISFVCQRETKEQRKNLEIVTGEAPDLIAASRIPVDYTISDPAQVTEMTVAVSGCEPADVILDESLQVIGETQADEGFTVTVRKPDYDSLLKRYDTSNLSYSGADDLQTYLAAEPLVQSRDDRIREKALELTAGVGTRWEAVENIAGWLHKTIRKEMRVTIPSAVEVLQTLRGDCNEHSQLFAALTRSLGIPTKICAGVAYQDGAFYYHAWNEVLIGDEDSVWLPVDSTWGETHVDATHFKLKEGSLDKQVELIKLIGTMKLRILDASYEGKPGGDR
ncbi:MAG: transglutaminase-like domain-containing protein [bacterium]